MPTGDPAVNRIAMAVTGGAAAAGFVAIAVLAAAGVITPVDEALHQRLRDYADARPGWLAAMAALTRLGDTTSLLVVLGVAVLVCRRQRRSDVATFALLAAGAVWGVSRLVRFLLARPRPDDRVWDASGFAYPSGHTTNAATIGLVLVAICWPLVGRLGRLGMALAAVGYPLTVGFTRVAGGVHWPSDVFGGILLAVAIFAGLAAVVGHSPPHRLPVRHHGG